MKFFFFDESGFDELVLYRDNGVAPAGSGAGGLEVVRIARSCAEHERHAKGQWRFHHKGLGFSSKQRKRHQTCLMQMKREWAFYLGQFRFRHQKPFSSEKMNRKGGTVHPCLCEAVASLRRTDSPDPQPT